MRYHVLANRSLRDNKKVIVYEGNHPPDLNKLRIMLLQKSVEFDERTRFRVLLGDEKNEE